MEVHSPEASTQGDVPVKTTTPTSSLGHAGTAEWVEQHAIPSVPEEEVSAPEETKESAGPEVATELTNDAPQEPAPSTEEPKDTVPVEDAVTEEAKPENNGILSEAEPKQEIIHESVEPASDPAPKPEKVDAVAQPPTEDASDNAASKPEELTDGVEKLSLA